MCTYIYIYILGGTFKTVSVQASDAVDVSDPVDTEDAELMREIENALGVSEQKDDLIVEGGVDDLGLDDLGLDDLATTGNDELGLDDLSLESGRCEAETPGKDDAPRLEGSGFGHETPVTPHGQAVADSDDHTPPIPSATADSDSSSRQDTRPKLVNAAVIIVFAASPASDGITASAAPQPHNAVDEALWLCEDLDLGLPSHVRQNVGACRMFLFNLCACMLHRACSQRYAMYFDHTFIHDNMQTKRERNGWAHGAISSGGCDDTAFGTLLGFPMPEEACRLVSCRL